MIHRFSVALVALAALVAAGCGLGRDPEPVASNPPVTSSTTPVIEPSRTMSPTAAAIPTVTAPPDTTVLHPQVRGTGSGDVGRVTVPARFAVSVACTGTGALTIQIDGRDELPTECGPNTDSFGTIVRRPAGQTEVRVSIRAATSVSWAAIVTTAP